LIFDKGTVALVTPDMLKNVCSEMRLKTGTISGHGKSPHRTMVNYCTNSWKYNLFKCI